MNYEISDIPFSRRGSYFAVSYLAQHKAIFIRDVHGGDDSPSELFELVLDDQGSDMLSQSFKGCYTIETDETHLRLASKEKPEQSVTIIMPQPDQLRLQVVGLNLKLKARKVRYDSLNQLTDTRYEYISYKKETKFLLEMVGDQIHVEAPWYRVGNPSIEIEMKGNEGPQEIILRNYQIVPPLKVEALPTFEAAHRSVQTEYQSWLEDSLKVPSTYQKGHDLANYIIWSSIVRPVGQLTQEAVYMSKNWMQNIWSWDNCFNAMGIGANHPELAFAQFQVFIDHQASSGVYPDFINDKYVSYNCCKPPIHAWAYEQLIQGNAYFGEPAQLEVIYKSLVASTSFWLTHRMTDSGLPYYTHGNDSGWDNASIFHHGLPVITPDLCAYLIQQLDLLSKWAQELGKEESAQWRQLADQLTARLLRELYVDQQFVARSGRTGEIIPEYQSLILCLPLVIAYRLPPEVVTGLKARIVTEFEGPFGLRTEASSSPHYQVDGYWLGPIWAPETYLFFDAFRRNGDLEVAKRLAEHYCQLATEHGMAENYNPETGTGNDDLSFTWTSSVFLLLGNYLRGLDDD